VSDYDLIGVEGTDPMFGMQIGAVVLRTHGPTQCSGEFCCIHNPSDHHMKEWPQNWRDDRGLMERRCPHGIGHPDPDDIAHKERMRGEKFAHYEAIHGCDGCCSDRSPRHD
jgi:hypothetical protein